MKSLVHRLKALSRENPSRRDVLRLLGLAGAACATPPLLALEKAATLNTFRNFKPLVIRIDELGMSATTSQ